MALSRLFVCFVTNIGDYCLFGAFSPLAFLQRFTLEPSKNGSTGGQRILACLLYMYQVWKMYRQICPILEFGVIFFTQQSFNTLGMGWGVVQDVDVLAFAFFYNMGISFLRCKDLAELTLVSQWDHWSLASHQEDILNMVQGNEFIS